jgi:3-dehydroquinate synthetase
LHDIAQDWKIDRLVQHCFGDKKAENHALTFITLEAIGQARIQKNVDAELVRVTAASFRKG